MRPIKFKIISTQSNYEEEQSYTIEELSEIIVNIKQEAFYPNLRLLQYTGRKDSKGVEIYEGDCLRIKSSNPFSKGEIQTGNVIFGSDGWHVEGTYSSLSEWLWDAENVEVIGNKFC